MAAAPIIAPAIIDSATVYLVFIWTCSLLLPSIGKPHSCAAWPPSLSTPKWEYDERRTSMPQVEPGPALSRCPRLPYTPATLAPQGLGAASRLIVACETP